MTQKAYDKYGATTQQIIDFLIGFVETHGRASLHYAKNNTNFNQIKKNAKSVKSRRDKIIIAPEEVKNKTLKGWHYD